jgi:hypothetical protein
LGPARNTRALVAGNGDTGGVEVATAGETAVGAVKEEAVAGVEGSEAGAIGAEDDPRPLVAPGESPETAPA